MSSVRAAGTDSDLNTNTRTIILTETPGQTSSSSPPPQQLKQDPGLSLESRTTADGRDSDPEKMFGSARLTLTSERDGGGHHSDAEPDPTMDASEVHQGSSEGNTGVGDDQQWVEDDSHELKRVKVYELIGSRWVDQGTAFCFGDFQDGEALLIARAENDFNQVILSTTIRSNDVYQRQQETLIVWTEPDGVDYALSFQDPEGCSEVWNFIQEVQRHLNTAVPGLSSSPVIGPEPSITTTSIIRSGHLPTPTLGIISEIDKAIKVLSRTANLKERVCEYIQTEEYIKALVQVFKQAEDLESLENLHALCSCVQTILMLNDHTMYEHILDDALFFGVVGMLEYDPEFPTHKANYREFLNETSRFHQPIPLRNQDIQKKIHHTYRLQFLKDVVLARAIDDSTFNVLNSCILFNQIDIINHVQNDIPFLREVVGMFLDGSLLGIWFGAVKDGEGVKDSKEGDKMDVDQPELPKSNGMGSSTSQPQINGSFPTLSRPCSPRDIQRRREVIFLLQQLCVMGKNVQLPARMALFRTLSDRGVLFAVQWALSQPERDDTPSPTSDSSVVTNDNAIAGAEEAGASQAMTGKAIIGAAGEVLGALLDYDLSGVRGFILKQVAALEGSLVGLGQVPGTPFNSVPAVTPAGAEGKEGRETILELGCHVLVRSRDMAIQSQMGEALRVLMEIPPQEVTEGTQPQPTIGAKLFQRPKDDPGVEKFLDYFYKQCADVLFNPLFDIPDFKNVTEPTLPLTRERTNLYLHLCELLSTFALQHSFRSHFYILSSSIAARVASLLKARDKHLKLAAFRFFRVLLKLNNRNLFNHLMKLDIFSPLLDLTIQEATRDNLLSSSCQELFETIRRENVKELIHHIMTKHESKVKILAETQLGGQRFKAFIARWEINIEPPPKEEEKSKIALTKPRMWGQGKLQDAEEEDYFLADDDEEPSTLSNAISLVAFPGFSKVNSGAPAGPGMGPGQGAGQKRKRMRVTGMPMRPAKQYLPQQPRSQPQGLGSLAEYGGDEEEGGEEPPSSAPSTPTLGAGIPDSPRLTNRQISLGELDLLQEVPVPLPPITEDEEDNLLEALVSKGDPPSPYLHVRGKPPDLNLGAKRRREDEDEELLERLASKSKRPSVTSIPQGKGAETKPTLTPPTPTKPEEGPAQGGVGGPKKIKLKLSGSVGGVSPSSTGAKDGDTG